MQSVPRLEAHTTDGPCAVPGRSAALWAVEGCALETTSVCSCHHPLMSRNHSLGTAGSWPRTELDEHRHLLTMVLLKEETELCGYSLQPWSPGCRAARGWKQTHEGDSCFRNGSSRAHSCSPMFSSFPPFLLLFAEGLRGAELSLLIEFTPKDIKLPQMLVLHPVASINLCVPHSH